MIKSLTVVLLVISVIHVFEEYFTGWIEYAGTYVKNIQKREFVFFNVIFVFLVTLSTILIIVDRFTIFNLSILFLILINSFIHILPSIRVKKYLPGLVTALFGYLPLSGYLIFHYRMSREVTNKDLFFAFLIGLFIMAVPFVYQIITKIILKPTKNK